jgi:hypothetical protein
LEKSPLSESLQPSGSGRLPGDDLDRAFRLTRSEFAALAMSQRRASRDGWSWLAAAGFVASLLGAMGLMTLRERLNWAASLEWWFLALGWAVALVPVVLWARRNRRLLHEHGLVCPGCSAPLVDTWLPRGYGDKVLVLGECLQCRAPLFRGEA